MFLVFNSSTNKLSISTCVSAYPFQCDLLENRSRHLQLLVGSPVNNQTGSSLHAASSALQILEVLEKEDCSGIVPNLRLV